MIITTIVEQGGVPQGHLFHDQLREHTKPLTDLVMGADSYSPRHIQILVPGAVGGSYLEESQRSF